MPQTRSLPPRRHGDSYRFNPSAGRLAVRHSHHARALCRATRTCTSAATSCPTNITTPPTYPVSSNSIGLTDIVYIGSNSYLRLVQPHRHQHRAWSPCCSTASWCTAFSASHYQILVTTQNANGTTTPTQIGNGQTLSGLVPCATATRTTRTSSRAWATPWCSQSRPSPATRTCTSAATTSHPTREDYQLRSNSASGDMVVVKNATSRVYFLGVHAAGFQSRSDFFVTASSYDPANTKLSVIPLINGVQVIGLRRLHGLQVLPLRAD